MRRSPTTRSSPTPGPSPSARADALTILVPRGAEAAAVRAASTGARVVAIAPGASSADAVAALRAGDPVVVTGLCGALRELRAGDVVVYRDVRDDSLDATACDATLTDSLTRALPHARTVRALTVPRVVTTRGSREELAARFDADVVDMEGAHVARALRARQIPFAMLRVVSDDASRDLPPLEDAIGAGGVRPLRVAAAFVRRPVAALAFVRGVRRALRALRETMRAFSAA